jgi:hypothetical protein
VDILTLKDRVEANEYRSDRHPAVPFVTFEDVLKTTPQPIKQHPECGASLTVGVGLDRVVRYCEKRMGHVWTDGTQHDWANDL